MRKLPPFGGLAALSLLACGLLVAARLGWLPAFETADVSVLAARGELVVGINDGSARRRAVAAARAAEAGAGRSLQAARAQAARGRRGLSRLDESEERRRPCRTGEGRPYELPLPWPLADLRETAYSFVSRTGQRARFYLYQDEERAHDEWVRARDAAVAETARPPAVTVAAPLAALVGLTALGPSAWLAAVLWAKPWRHPPGRCPR